MKIETDIPLIDDLLGARHLRGYRNHVYRMVNFCFVQADLSAEQKEKIIIAACFHDLGIWSANTFDYLPPSIELAREHLATSAKQSWELEIITMIDLHHRIRSSQRGSLVEIFRVGDLVDFSLGVVKGGIPAGYIRDVKNQFPNEGFHKELVRHACRWLIRHPLHPVPVLKW